MFVQAPRAISGPRLKREDMIKFFRRIRQKLLSENRISKYLIYAIGEIVLVVIGILLALQINNRNEENKSIERQIDAELN